MSLCLTFKRLEGPPCVTVLSHKGPSNKSMWQYLDLCLFRYVFFMSLYLTSKRLEGPQCVTVLSHKGPWRDSLVWKNCPIRDTGGTPFCDSVCFSRFRVGFYGFQDSRLVFHGSRSVFHDSRSILTGQPDSFMETAVTPERKVEKIVSKVGN